MGSITKQEQTMAIPARQTIGFHREHGDLFPVLQFCHPVSKIWGSLGNRLAQGRESGCTHLMIGALGDDVADLPVILAFEEEQGPSTTEACHQPMRIIGLA